MPQTMNDPAPEITVVGPDYWADHSAELSALLGAAAQGRNPVIADPSGRASGLMAMVVDPAYWSSQPRELADAMRRAGGSDAPTADAREDRLASGAATSQDRLTLTVEEAAAALGISRALAYEAVQRGDIPCIRIGRRILVPRSGLARLLDSPGEQAGSGQSAEP